MAHSFRFSDDSWARPPPLPPRPDYSIALSFRIVQGPPLTRVQALTLKYRMRRQARTGIELSMDNSGCMTWGPVMRHPAREFLADAWLAALIGWAKLMALPVRLAAALRR